MSHKKKDIFVVGIGASAGGLEPLERLFSNIPDNIRCAFIVVQHLSPDYKSLMNKLLERVTHIPISIIKNNTEIKENTIYLNPPRKTVTISGNKLFLQDQDSNILHLPIDAFFKSLGKEKKDLSLGVILSGTGRDGSEGIKTIKANGGIVITQDLKSAKFTGMPQNAILTGSVDYSFKPEQLAKVIVSYISYTYSDSSAPFSIVELENNNFIEIIDILKNFSKIDFSRYKESTISRRLERRMTINKKRTLSEYTTLLANSLEEKKVLTNELLIGVTSFFRDRDAFESLSNNVLTKLIKNQELKIWCIGASTGQEVYSLIISLLETLNDNNLSTNLKVFATDVDKESLSIASLAFYPLQIKEEIDADLLSKYFVLKRKGYQIKENVRKHIVFARHNILTDSPFTKIDLIMCRNLFIYFKDEVQAKLIKMFYYCLKPEGYLMLGSSETIGELDNLFSPVDFKWKIFKKIKGYELGLTERLPYLVSKRDGKTKGLIETNLIQHKNHTLELLTRVFSKFFPPSVIITSNGEIIYILNDVSDYLHFQDGSFNQNIFTKVTKDMGIHINSLIRKIKLNKNIDYLETIISLPKESDFRLTISVREIVLNEDLFYIISFDKQQVSVVSDSELSKANQTLIIEDCEELQKELNYTKENLRIAVEELESSNEELQSSNEELMASNEELQSTNEELQSVNEELYSVNTEFQEKIVELEGVNNDMLNLLETTEIGALYLDKYLKIRKFTPLIQKLTNIRKSDIGRPVTDITIVNGYSFLSDIEKVEETLNSIDKKLKLANGKTYLIRLRPYRTEYNSVDGVLVSFIEISEKIQSLEKLDNR